jgi:RsiW-degrading membrane proteinase PrsW (M82 family)
MFIWGSIIAFGFSIILEGFSLYFISNYLVLIVILVPIVEEISKAFGLCIVKHQILKFEDGIFLGVFSGIGFVTTENLLYGGMLSNEGSITILSLFLITTIGRTLLHVSATALTGYGYSKKIIRHRKLIAILPYISFSIGIHAIYNLLALSELVTIQILGVSISILFTLVLVIFIRKNIRLFDKKLASESSALIKIH